MMGKISGQMQILLIDINELVPENHLLKQTGKKKMPHTRMRRIPLIGWRACELFSVNLKLP